jgi:hypothetical protein
MNQYEFSDKIDREPNLANQVILDYAKLELQAMTPEEKDAWITRSIESDFALMTGDEIVDILVNEYPDWLKSTHNVCII